MFNTFQHGVEKAALQTRQKAYICRFLTLSTDFSTEGKTKDDFYGLYKARPSEETKKPLHFWRMRDKRKNGKICGSSHKKDDKYHRSML